METKIISQNIQIVFKCKYCEKELTISSIKADCDDSVKCFCGAEYGWILKEYKDPIP